MNNEYECAENTFFITTNSEGVCTIKVAVNGMDYIVEPYMIFNTIFNHQHPVTTFYASEENYIANKGEFVIMSEIKYDEIIWELYHKDKIFPKHLCFNKTRYIEQIACVLEEFREKVSSGCTPLYKESRVRACLLDELTGMCEQLHVCKDMLVKPYPLLKDVNKEAFLFDFTSPFCCDTDFEISIGERTYKSSLSDWSNELEHIRYMIEGIAYKGEIEVDICFEDSPTRLILKKVRTRTNDNAFSRDGSCDFMSVTVIPNSFVNGPILFGYCNREATIRSLYEGLLKLALKGYEQFGMDNTIIWDQYKMTIYNKLKSPILEDFINKIGVEEYSFRQRQRDIKKIYTICPDYDTCIWDENGLAYSCEDGVLELDINGEDFTFENIEMARWQHEYECAVDFVSGAADKGFDWAEWHHRGIALAHLLRQELPRSCDIWYRAPFEDKSNTIRDMFLIMQE